MSGAVDLLVPARTALLDALEALAGHHDALVLVGAQAIYLQTENAPVALAEATKDSDLAIDPRILGSDPLIDAAMNRAGFHRDLVRPQPGGWISGAGIPVDLMVPETLAGPGAAGRRGARIPPHGKSATRRTPGLEAAVVDHAPMTIRALDPSDTRTFEIAVAGPAALLVAKLHKIGERTETPERLNDKDAHDIYRLLVATETPKLADTLRVLAADPLAGPTTTEAIQFLRELFADTTSLGSQMAGRAEGAVGDPERAAKAVSVLAVELAIELS